MPKKLAIGFDLDGVIIDHTSNKLAAARELGYALSARDTASGVLKSKMRQADYRALQRRIYGPASIDAAVMEGARKTIAELAGSHDLYIISRRNAADGGDALGQAWLQKNEFLRSIPKANVFFVPHDIVGAKNAVAERLGIAVYMDDQQKILDELSSVPHRLLFDPHDTESVDAPFRKIKTWQEFSATIERLL